MTLFRGLSAGRTFFHVSSLTCHTALTHLPHSGRGDTTIPITSDVGERELLLGFLWITSGAMSASKSDYFNGWHCIHYPSPCQTFFVPGHYSMSWFPEIAPVENVPNEVFLWGRTWWDFFFWRQEKVQSQVHCPMCSLIPVILPSLYLCTFLSLVMTSWDLWGCPTCHIFTSYIWNSIIL